MGVTYNYGAGPTYTKIASQTLGSAQATVTFNSIPSTYTDLVLICFVRGTYTGGGSVTLLNYFNNDTTALYSNTQLQGNGTTATSSRQSGQNFGRLGEIASANTTAGVFSTVISHIQNYSNTTTFKTNLVRHDNSALNTQAWVNLYRSTSAISRLDIQCSASNIVAGSTFTLYGIKAALVPKATGGDLIVNDGTYWYHTFRNSGVFSIKQNLTVDYLVIAGGGGGGSRGGGGGAGGLSYFSSQALSGSGYTVTVGSGGAGSIITTNKGTNGSNSQFGSSTASVGGGGGGSSDNRIGANGGSGGGGVVGSAGGTGTAGQGNNGGTNSSTGGEDTSSGGGGAGAAGGNGTTTTAGVGGIGLNTYSSWATATSTGVSGYYAGGGGGMGNSVSAAGGTGGGGQGRGGLNGIDGTANTGGGGGGAGHSGGVGFRGGAGGSGLVIVRYAV